MRKSIGFGSWGLQLALAAGFIAVPGGAQIVKEGGGPLAALERSSERLRTTHDSVTAESAGGSIAADVQAAWAAFNDTVGGQWTGYFDRRTGRLDYAEGSGLAWIPGRGNRLAESGGTVDLARLEALGRDFLRTFGPAMGVDPAGLVLAKGRSGPVSDYLWLVDFDVLWGGLPVEGARVVFRVNNGNLIQVGTENLPAPGSVIPKVALSREDALAKLSAYVGGFGSADTFLDTGSRHLIPVAVDNSGFAGGFEPGKGRGLAQVWELTFRREGVLGTWRGRIDATTGEFLELADVNHYANVRGGIYADNTVGEANWPLPNADISVAPFTANSAGVYAWPGGVVNSTLNSNFVSIVDNCGLISKGSNGVGDILFGLSGGTDCTTPGSGGLGNTHSSRTQFYWVNRIKEVGRGWLPGNAWLNADLTVNVNLNMTCNAYWNGFSLNFFKSSGFCGNSGEIPMVSLHEYGHGLDSNDGSAGHDQGTGEFYGDTTAFLLTHNSCIGNGFFLTGNCSGYGDGCLACSGIRDVDFAKHVSNTAATPDNFTRTHCNPSGYAGPCAREGHCESYVPSEAVWDLANRDLPSPGTNSAWSVVDRLWYLSRSTQTNSFVCNTGSIPWISNGCATGTLFRVMRAVDDDDGNLANGTPHGGAIFTALDRHAIACSTDAGGTVTHAACTPPVAPTVTLTPGVGSVTIGWASLGGGIVYDVYKNETGCGTQFAKIANDVAGTSLVDSVVNGYSLYSYQVIAHPAGNEACSSPPSACKSTTLAPHVNVWSKDKPWDTGLEPDPATAANNMWESEDIWVTPTSAPGGTHTDPTEGIKSWVHVKVRSMPTPAITAENVPVRVYYAVASTGLAWPINWTLIGTGIVTTLAPGGTAEVIVPWIPLVSGHICMVARLDTAQDPMTNPETTDINFNTRFNNNIVWRNMNVIHLFAGGNSGFNFVTRNTERQTARVRLTLHDRLDRGVQRPFLTRGAVVLDLGQDLWTRWQGSGGESAGIVLREGYEIEVQKDGAYLIFKQDPQEAFTVRMTVFDGKVGTPTGDSAAPQPIPVDKDELHVLEIAQDDADTGFVIGGITYQVFVSTLHQAPPVETGR
ncbi:MAG TPA: hypothetical protein VN783_03160 [Thermoanaerobaculia bacterium]|nr:hypothetical protein [Thermoanaerobaculia bacterium]